jgi:hypothetical protein
VSISGDTIVVGALLEDSNATGANGDQNNDEANESGAAYVFVRDGNTWTQQAYLKATSVLGGSGFGYSVAVHEQIVVGLFIGVMSFVFGSVISTGIYVLNDSLKTLQKIQLELQALQEIALHWMVLSMKAAPQE